MRSMSAPLPSSEAKGSCVSLLVSAFSSLSSWSSSSSASSPSASAGTASSPSGSGRICSTSSGVSLRMPRSVIQMTSPGSITCGFSISFSFQTEGQIQGVPR